MNNEDLLEPVNNDSVKKELIMIPVDIFNYFILGLKTITTDFFLLIYNAISWRVNKTYSDTLDSFKVDDIYEKTRLLKKKKAKTYTYSAKTLAKLEKEKQEFMQDLHESGATRSKIAVTYQFKVRESNGKITTGTIKGFSKLDVNAFLLNEGYEIISIITSRWITFINSDVFGMGSTKIKSRELIFFLTQLSTYLKAGLTLSNSIRILSKQIGKDKAKTRAFQAISYELTLGESFSNAMERQGDMFPALLINMIKAAEASGTLIQTLEEMAQYYTDIHTTKKQMVSAITYPVTILIFAVIVVTFILIYVVPQFTEIYATNDAEITGVTLIVMLISDFLKNHGLTLLIGIIISVMAMILMYKQIKSFRTAFQILAMKIPIIKDIVIYNELTIFSKTFASLLKNNVFITDSMSILSNITRNEIYKSILYKTINNIIVGEKISEAFEDHWAVPDIAYYMIVTGESTGELDTMMERVSDYYQEMHKSVINNLKALIEPVLTAFLAVVVGLIIVAVIIPMYGIYDTLQ